MEIATNVSLAQLSTMGLGGQAAYATTVASRNELLGALDWAHGHGNLPVIMVGGGSNIVWRDKGFPGLVIVNKIRGFDVLERGSDGSLVHVIAGSGEVWDNIVRHTVTAGYTGIECLSLIPGSVGATPVQNVGAYGQEISRVLVSVEAFDARTAEFVEISFSECNFGYRTSRFNTVDRGRFYITAVTLRLTKTTPQPQLYAALQSYLDDRQITIYTPQVLRDAVIAIRKSKLPDPSVVRNCGSFFANPITTHWNAQALKTVHDNLPIWPVDEGSCKLSAAWLIEQAGFKNYHDSETGMATWITQPLVCINEHASSTADLLRFQEKIINAVYVKFAVRLFREPVLLPITEI
ncbi:UDP-N-acetylenolpyruvoylglucosamine reductase 1 [Whalleya microplaca]|nr:UDP-N-acetylenolpyruvoylglucosamine reductase 1 [Whalleya microplaca]